MGIKLFPEAARQRFFSDAELSRIGEGITEFVKDESGATSIEYAFIAAATGLALAGVMPTIKSDLSVKFTAISDNLQ